MSDFLLELGQNPNARRLIKALGLPIPMPQQLRRAEGPWEERPLRDQKMVYAAAGTAQVAPQVAVTLARAGADPLVVAGDGVMGAFVDPGEAYGRPATRLDPEQPGDELAVNGVVIEATDLADPAALRPLYDLLHPLIGRIKSSGRVVVLGRPPEDEAKAPRAAAQAALEGFVRSLARETGRRGTTAQLVYVSQGAEDRLEPVLRFLLSARSAFVSGQPVRITAQVAAPAQVPQVRPLEGKVALVTGAARGIGAATARVMAGEGAHVVCLDRPADDGPTSQLARDLGGSVLLVDVTDGDAPARIREHLQREHGGVDIVVHNAGVTRDKTLARMKPEHWDQAIDINLGAVTRITGALLEDGLRDQGRLVFLSSVAGIAGNMGQTNYAASKSGVIGYVRALAGPLAKRGIAVNAVAPGFIETRLTAAIPVMIREVGRRLSNLGQGGQPQDVAEVITFLSTPGAYGLTGTVLRVCGGAYVGA
jgi:3-oxoacyl-[acyl-carrier protein] reductase